MRLSIAVLLLASTSIAYADCNPTDLRDNVRWCTINAASDVRSAFCREISDGNESGAFGSLDDCERKQSDHDKIIKNAQDCGSKAVLDAVREFKGNLDCH